MMLGHHCRHHFDRAFVIKALAWPDVQLVCNCIQLLLAMARKVRAFRQILAYQAVDVLIACGLVDQPRQNVGGGWFCLVADR